MRPEAYMRPKKPKTIPVRRRDSFTAPPADALPAPVAVDAATQCHVTPPGVAARMVDYLDPPDGLILEPSAGTGNLIAALHAAHPGRPGIVAIERHATLAAGLETRFPNLAVKQECFLDYAARVPARVQYAAVLMNPPFKGITAHMSAALALLAPGGCLVALVPITYDHPDAEHLENLPADTFAAATVNTKLVRFYNHANR